MRDIYKGTNINLIGYAYRLVIGKSATPFYYIIVLIQLTIITPWLVDVIKQNKKIKNLLWFVTPGYLIYVYVWNFVTGASPHLYETLFPAWFGFYYLGLYVRSGLRLCCNIWCVFLALAISCVEAFGLRRLGMSSVFYTSQITIGSFLYSVAVIGWIFKLQDGCCSNLRWIGKIGDCSYGIFYVHMIVLVLIEKLMLSTNWYLWCGMRFALTSAISFGIVLIGQKIFENKKKIAKYIGFV